MDRGLHLTFLGLKKNIQELSWWKRLFLSSDLLNAIKAYSRDNHRDNDRHGFTICQSLITQHSRRLIKLYDFWSKRSKSAFFKYLSQAPDLFLTGESAFDNFSVILSQNDYSIDQVAESLILLHQTGLLSTALARSNRTLISKHQSPYDLHEALGLMLNNQLLNSRHAQAYFKTVASNEYPTYTASILIQLNYCGLLKTEQEEELLSSIVAHPNASILQPIVTTLKLSGLLSGPQAIENYLKAASHAGPLKLALNRLYEAQLLRHEQSQQIFDELMNASDLLLSPSLSTLLWKKTPAHFFKEASWHEISNLSQHSKNPVRDISDYINWHFPGYSPGKLLRRRGFWLPNPLDLKPVKIEPVMEPAIESDEESFGRDFEDYVSPLNT